MKKIFVLLIVIFIVGCSIIEDVNKADKQAAKEYKLKQQQSIDACLKQNGIPIYSAWDGRLKDCKFNQL